MAGPSHGFPALISGSFKFLLGPRSLLSRHLKCNNQERQEQTSYRKKSPSSVTLICQDQGCLCRLMMTMTTTASS